MNWTILIGTLSAVGLAVFSLRTGGSGRSLFNMHGVTVVIGGTIVSTLINSPLSLIWGTFIEAASLFFPPRLPSPEAVVTEMSRLARRAQTEGGLLSLQGQSQGFANGWLNRAVNVAIAAGESDETRRVLEVDVRQLRIRRQENANLMRTMGTLSPMFGLLGTLLGMIEVLETISTPTKVGPAMALALSSAFMGISLANLVCIPLAGAMRLRAMNETLVLEMILEGILDIAAGKPSSLVEMHLSGYAGQRRSEGSPA